MSEGQRTGLVLGGGGTLGATWMIGAMNALYDELGFDARSADLILGTSAGAILAALVGAGASPQDLWLHQESGDVLDGPLAGQVFDYDHAGGGALPLRPQAGIGSPKLIASAVRHPRRYPNTAVFSAFLPPGRGSLDDVRRMVEDITPAGAWSPHPGVRIVAMDYDTGDRVAFGAPGAPEIGMADAVVASCSIPGWFAPVMLGERRFVDGGAFSANSIDLVVADGLPGGEPLDVLYVLAPSCAREYDRPRSALGRLERAYRHRVTRQMLHEAKQVRQNGTRVIVLCPGADDLEVLGVNLMDPTRRADVLITARRTVAEFLNPARAVA
ncbi:MAG: patatin-like phospholipase family protein [Actinocrinis sp.]